LVVEQRRTCVGLVALVAVSVVVAEDDPIQPKARAVHILVETEEKALALKAELDASDDPATLFGELAWKHSRCPTGKMKGTLGEWTRGKMVKAFDDVVFDDATPLRRVVGPVASKSGWHLIRVTQRESAEMLAHRRSMAKLYARQAAGEL